MSDSDLRHEIVRNFLRRFATCLEGDPRRAQAAQVLEASGISLDELQTGDHPPGFNRYYSLLERLAPLLMTDGFYLRLGQSYDILDLGVLGYAMLSASSLRASWDISLAGSPLLPHPSRSTRYEERDRIIIRLEVWSDIPEARVALAEEWMAGTWRWIHTRLPELAGDRTVEVSFPHAPPAYDALYRSIFPGPVHFDAAHCQFSLPASCYDLPLSAANPSISQLCLDQCDKLIHRIGAHSDLVDRLRRYLVMRPGRPLPKVGDAAEALGLPPHILQRRLAAMGSSFREVLLETRMALAQQYLAETDLSIKEIGFLAGYAHIPSFYRAYRMVFDQTPDETRQARHS